MSNVKIKSYSQPRQENLKDKNIQSIPQMNQKPLFRGESYRNQERPSYNQQVYIVDNKENNSYKYLHSQQQNNPQQLRQVRPSSSNIRNEKPQDQQYLSRPHSNSHDKRDKKDQYTGAVTQVGPQIQQFHINSAPFLNLKKLLTDNRGSSMKEDSNLKNSLVIPVPSTQLINPQVTQVKQPITTYSQNSQQKSDRYFSNNEQSYQIQQHSNQKQYYQSSQQQYQQNRSQNSQQQQSQQKIFPQQQQQQQQQFYQQQHQQKQQLLLQQQQKLQQYQSQQIQTIDTKKDDRKFYQSVPNEIRLKQQIQRQGLANTSQTQNKVQDISQSQTDTCLLLDQQGNQNSTKRSQEFQEYKKLQDKLQYLENKIISIKSNIDCSNPHLSKNSNTIKKDQKGKGLTAKFFGGRDDKKKQSNEVRDQQDNQDNQDQKDICVKKNEQDIRDLHDKQDQQNKLGLQNKQEQDKQYLRLQDQKDRQDKRNKKILQNKYDEQNQQQKNDEVQMSQKIKPKEELQSTSLSSFITQVKQSDTLSSTLRSIQVQPESAKASSNYPLYQIPIDRKRSQDINKFTTVITSQQKANIQQQFQQPLPKKQTHFLFYVSSIISAYMAQQITKTVEQAREHLVLTVQAIQFAKTMKVTQQHLINERQKFLPKRDLYINKKTLVFDLDETLIHCNESAQVPGDVYLPILFPTGELIEASINVRPYAQQILENLSKDFEIIIFTASHSCYANVVLDYLDPDKLWISHRLYRESCVQSEEGAYIKDLRVLADRNLSDLLLIDNAAYSFGLQLPNGIPILPYYEDKQDQELLHLQDYLMQFKNVKDMRDFNSRSLKIDRFSEFNHPIDLLQKLFKELIPQQ